MTWQVTYKSPVAPPAAGDVAVELVNGKPPYQWKHGWIPLTPDATLIKAKKRTGSAKDAPAGRNPERGHHQSEVQTRALDVSKNGGFPIDRPAADNRQLENEWSGSTKAQAFTEDEQVALDTYQWGEPKQYGSGEWYSVYSKLNHYRRNGPSSFTEDERNELDAVDRGMKSALSKSRTTRNLTVYRGVSGKPPLKAGDVVTDAAWVSTSYDPHQAYRFATVEFSKSLGKDDKIMVISVPKGTPALRPTDPEELELALGPDVPMRVVREDGPLVYLEVIA